MMRAHANHAVNHIARYMLSAATLWLGFTGSAAAETNKLSGESLEAFAALMDRDFATPADDTENIIVDGRLRLDNFPAPGIWLYTQLNTGANKKLYRQRLNQFTLSSDGKAIIHRAYVLKQALFDRLAADDYNAFMAAGCEQRWTQRQGGEWYGRVNPKSCRIFSKRRNKHIHIGAEVTISQHRYQTAERGYDEQLRQIWGTKPGEYITLNPIQSVAAPQED